MMKHIFQPFMWLNSAETVCRFQNYFGIVRKRNCTSSIRVNNGHNITNHVKEQSNNDKQMSYEITSKFFYVLFKLGSFLGQEEFYIVFFPFWFWTFDATTGRKLMFIWMLCMHFGQVAKDYFRMPRPSSPPAVHLENTFLSEYGMPSTHATVAASIPLSVVYFQQPVCHYPMVLAAFFIITWTALVCSSRIYMGVHTILEVLSGLTISILVTSVLITNMDNLDMTFMSTFLGPVLMNIACFSASFLYPSADNKFTRSWSDAVAILSSTAGIFLGSWLEVHLSQHLAPTICIIDHVSISFKTIFNVVSKTMIGVAVLISAKNLAQFVFDFLHHKVSRKFFAYFFLGLNVFSTPAVYRYLKW